MRTYNTATPEAINQAGHDYRIEKINKIQCSLQETRDKRRELSNKYNTGVKWVNNLDVILIAISMRLGATGMGLLSTIVAAPVVVILEGVALGTGFLSIIGKYANKKLTLQAQKHERITVLAEAKLNSISDYISKALNDGKISEEEFSLILSVLNKFQEMKNKIRTKTREDIDEETSNTLKPLLKKEGALN